MTRAWFGDAVKVPGRDAGVMDGTNGTRKVILHTEGVTRGARGRDGDAVALAKYVAGANIGYHLVVDSRGRVAQVYPATVGSRALLAGAWSPNRQGVLAIQVCFAGVTSAADVAHWGPEFWRTWARLMAWFDDLGVPRVSHVAWGPNATRSEANWRRSGFAGHLHSPMNDHTDGRGAPIERLLDAGKRTPAGDTDRPAEGASRPAEGPRRKWRVVATTRFGGRRFVYRTKTGFSFRKGRVRLTAGEVEAAKRWARRRAVRDVRPVPLGQFSHVEVASGVRWPSDRRLLKVLNEVGRRRKRLVVIRSGRRTLEEQRRLWELWQAGKGNLAAYPNANAPHIRGVAADVGILDRSGTYKSLRLDSKADRIARRLGASARIPSEPWHYQMDDTY